MRKLVIGITTFLLSGISLQEPAYSVTATIPNPTVDGYALDYCREWTVNCGQLAADAYCQATGYDYAYSYEVTYNSPPTKTIGDERICNASFCDRISSVTCVR